MERVARNSAVLLIASLVGCFEQPSTIGLRCDHHRQCDHPQTCENRRCTPQCEPGEEQCADRSARLVCRGDRWESDPCPGNRSCVAFFGGAECLVCSDAQCPSDQRCNANDTCAECITAYEDSDGDGFGAKGTGVRVCDDEEVPPGFVENDYDCNDGTAEELANEGYFDGDGDGFGAGDLQTLECGKPNQLVGVAGDCGPNDPEIRPDQEMPFFDPIKGAELPYDYNCDGEETPRWGMGHCAFPCEADFVEGFRDEVPACGEEGVFLKSCAQAGPAGCHNDPEVRKQECL